MDIFRPACATRNTHLFVSLSSMKGFLVSATITFNLLGQIDAQFRPFAVDPGIFFPVGPQGNVPPVGWMKRHGPNYEDRFSPEFGDSETYGGRQPAHAPGGSQAAAGLSEIIEGAKDLETLGATDIQSMGPHHPPLPPTMPTKQEFDIMRDRQRLHLRQQEKRKALQHVTHKSAHAKSKHSHPAEMKAAKKAQGTKKTAKKTQAQKPKKKIQVLKAEKKSQPGTKKNLNSKTDKKNKN
eukprot:Blabericola_migrator_1__13388@NODE_954_length_5901_cov_132_878985_g662_i0_p4_GENE_NODE_954_length_5901_cov_132_878985_g662_i0NODE_954_length_5901_cov_132_878985_g662_i0_p4_ORF_typecomplete_len238_score47_59Casc1/PF12366_8/0_59_NODE_954_length_5901_cov_132_878985_g662_i015252238